MKQPTPLTLFESAIINCAVEFTATIFVNRAYQTTRHAQFAEAVASAKAMNAAATNGRKAMVYAVNADGRFALIPNAATEGTNAMPNTTKTTTTAPAAPKKATATPKDKAAPKPKPVKAAAPKRDLVKAAKAITAAGETTIGPKAVKVIASSKQIGKRAAAEAAAAAGALPMPPDFTADTHARFREKLAQLVALVKAKDVAGLEAFEINPISSSRKAMDRYRTLAVIALKARAAKTAK